MKLAYCSPFNPVKSGISDFSEELVIELKKCISVDLFCDVLPNKDAILNNFNYYPLRELYNEDIRKNYDAIVYHMGNNIDIHKKIADTFLSFSGFLELHDFSLHNFLAADTFVKNDIEGYLEEVRYSHGEKGAKMVQSFLDGNGSAPWESHALELTVNKRFIDKAQGVIVHSEMAKQMVKGIRPNVPVINIPLHTPDFIDNPELRKDEAKRDLHFENTTLIFGSFGYATRSKRILQALEALAVFKQKQADDFHYFIVGKVDDIDVVGKINELGLQDNVTVTGFTSLEDFKIYMNACDICFNLRYPTHGESSASLHRMLGMGKPVIVTQIGTFEEYPDDVVIKVHYDEHEVQDIYNAICTLTNNKEELAQRGDNALRFAKANCDLTKNAKRYADFFESVVSGTYQADYVDSFLDKLFQLRLTENYYADYAIYKLGSLFG
jgi:glycosyltransferase involved in cell wall biosynthesis